MAIQWGIMKTATDRIRSKASCGARETEREILLRFGCPYRPYCPSVSYSAIYTMNSSFLLKQYEWFSFLAVNKFQSHLQIHKVSLQQ